MSYAVQVSRELDPYGDGDRAFFVRAPAAGRRLPPDRIWLGVVLQAHNDSDRPQRAAGAITVADSFDHVFRPVRLGADNTYAYGPTTLAAGDSEPGPSSPAAYSPEQGSLLLFDVPLSSSPRCSSSATRTLPASS